MSREKMTSLKVATLGIFILSPLTPLVFALLAVAGPLEWLVVEGWEVFEDASRNQLATIVILELGAILVGVWSIFFAVYGFFLYNLVRLDQANVT